MSKKSSREMVVYEYTGPEGHSPVLGLLYKGRRFKPGELPPEIEHDLCAQGVFKQATVNDEGGET